MLQELVDLDVPLPADLVADQELGGELVQEDVRVHFRIPGEDQGLELARAVLASTIPVTMAPEVQKEVPGREPEVGQVLVQGDFRLY